MTDQKRPRIIATKADANEFLFQEPYLAFLDILGFSTLVKNNQHEQLVELYDNIFSKTVDTVDQMMKKISKKRKEEGREDYTDSGLRLINISDSIIIWTTHGQPTALFEIVFAASTLMGISLIQGLPLRGCITRQKFSVKENGNAVSVIGKGLVHAYNQEKLQQWAGCIIDDEIINYFRGIEKHFGRWERPAEIERDNLVYEYDIPIINKENKEETKRGFAVNWSEPYFTESIITEAFDAHKKKDTRPGSSTPAKIKNTLAFHDFCEEKRKQREATYEKLKTAFDSMKKQDEENNETS